MRAFIFPRATMTTDSPDILLILTDQHRLSAVGAYGPTPCQTPHIDRLAAEGVRFQTAYTTCPVCSPARGSVLTGLYPHSHGICSNAHNLGSSVHEVPDSPDLLSRRLQDRGYACGYTGKWHLGNGQSEAFSARTDPALPSTRGFQGQDFPGHGGGGFNYPDYRAYLETGGFMHEVKPWSESVRQVLPTGELIGPTESTVPHFLADHTISLINRLSTQGSPYFVWHNFWGPHGPYFSPTEFVDLYRDIEIPPWPNYDWPSRETPGPHHVKIHPDQESLTWDDWATAIRYYYAFTTLIDRQIGRIVEHLRQSDRLDRTIIIFAADHGETAGSHGGLTDKGWQHFEEIQRIPCIVRFPDGRFAGQVREGLVSLADLYPTILDLAGGQSPDRIHGRSLLPLIDEPSTSWRDHLVVEFSGVNNLSATLRTLVKGDLKYGFSAGHDDQLYDLASDPYELVNVATEPSRREQLEDARQMLSDWMADHHDPVRGIFNRTRLP